MIELIRIKQRAALSLADCQMSVSSACRSSTASVFMWRCRSDVSRCMFRMRRSPALRCVCVCVLLSVCCRAFELQDTIHALIEENIHLHDQLENLTRALRELRQLLFQHSGGASCSQPFIYKSWTSWILSGIFKVLISFIKSYMMCFTPDHTHEHDEELQHLWEEWSQHSELLKQS